MAKAGNKSTTIETPEQRIIREALRVAYEVDRYEWLCGHTPFMPTTAPAMAPLPPKKSTAIKRTTNQRNEGDGPQQRRLTSVFIECWPPHGKPPPLAKLSNPDLVQMAGDEYERRYKGRTISRNSILRKAGRLPR